MRSRDGIFVNTMDSDAIILASLSDGLFRGLTPIGPLDRLVLRAATGLPRLPRRVQSAIIASRRCQASSLRLRHSLRDRHGVLLGAWSGGPGVTTGVLPRNTVVGRYCSIGPGIVVATENHPLDRLSVSGIFYDPDAGHVRSRTLQARPLLAIGHDVWIGGNSSILPGCLRIGHGAVVGAGSVVTRDIPPYAIVMGNPARIHRFRYPAESIAHLLASRWWSRSPDELVATGWTAKELVPLSGSGLREALDAIADRSPPDESTAHFDALFDAAPQPNFSSIHDAAQ